MIKQITSLVIVSFLLVALGGGSALAQNDRSQGNSFKLGDYDTKDRQKAPKLPALDQDPSVIHRQAERWPWLEPGTIVCPTQDGLSRYHAAVAAKLNGEVAAAPIGECRRLNKRTPIDIADRRGRAITEIHLFNDPSQTGWTDVWLPPQRPN